MKITLQVFDLNYGHICRFCLASQKKNYKEKVVGKNAPGDFIASPVSTNFPLVFESQFISRN